MNSFFYDEESSENPGKLSLDELYEKKQKRALKVLHAYNTILTRIHNRIKLVSRQRINEQFCWFVVPQMMFGVTDFNSSDCVVYLIKQLEDNGFKVVYTHPNLLLISWKHWIPGYVRHELKKKTGIEVDGLGNSISKPDDESTTKPSNPFGFQYQQNEDTFKTNTNDSHKQEKDTKTFNPSNLIYTESLLKGLREKLK